MKQNEHDRPTPPEEYAQDSPPTTVEDPQHHGCNPLASTSPDEPNPFAADEDAIVELHECEQGDKAALDEALFNYHGQLTAAGRAGKFTPFLRDRLHWPAKRAYDKAMRRIARHKLKVGLIDKAEYERLQGNAKRSTPLRGASATGGQVPQLTQSFEIETDDFELVSPAVDGQQLASAERALNDRKKGYGTAVLHRALLTEGEHYWFTSAVRLQQKRHHTCTYSETLRKVFLCGRKMADEGDEFGQLLDEFHREVGENPALAVIEDELDRRDVLMDADAEELATHDLLIARSAPGQLSAVPRATEQSQPNSAGDLPSSNAVIDPGCGVFRCFPDDVSLDDLDDPGLPL